MRKIYISGPMTGRKYYNHPAFMCASYYWQEEGFIVLNPATLPEGLEQSEYMDICMAMVRAADVIYMLHGYKESDGALAELTYAKKLGMEIIEQ